MKNIIISANEYESTNTFDENDLSPHLMNVLNRTTRRNKTIKVGSNKDYNMKDLNDIVDDAINELPLMRNLRKELKF